MHLPLGKNTLQYFREKMEKIDQEIAAREEVITGSDHDNALIKK